MYIAESVIEYPYILMPATFCYLCQVNPNSIGLETRIGLDAAFSPMTQKVETRTTFYYNDDTE